jgi:hypothetical protein
LAVLTQLPCRSEKKKRKKRNKSCSGKARKPSIRGSGAEQPPASSSPALGAAPAPAAGRLPELLLSPQPFARVDDTDKGPAEVSSAVSPSPLEEARGEERVLDPIEGLQLVPSSGAQKAPSDGFRGTPNPTGEERAAPSGTAPGAIVAFLLCVAPEDLVGRVAAHANALIQEVDRLLEEMSRASEDLSRGTGQVVGPWLRAHLMPKPLSRAF